MKHFYERELKFRHQVMRLAPKDLLVMYLNDQNHLKQDLSTDDSGSEHKKAFQLNAQY